MYSIYNYKYSPFRYTQHPFQYKQYPFERSGMTKVPPGARTRNALERPSRAAHHLWVISHGSNLELLRH